MEEYPSKIPLHTPPAKDTKLQKPAVSGQLHGLLNPLPRKPITVKLGGRGESS